MQDLLTEFDQHCVDKCYDFQVVDIMLQALCNTVEVPIIEADMRDKETHC